VPALSPAVNDSRAALSRALKGLEGNAGNGGGVGSRRYARPGADRL